MRSFAPVAAAVTVTILSVSLIGTLISSALVISKQEEVITAQQGAITALRRQIEAEQRLSRSALDLAQQRKLLVDAYRSGAVPFSVPDRISDDPSEPLKR